MAWTKKPLCLAPIKRAIYHDPRVKPLCQNAVVPGAERCRHHQVFGPKKRGKMLVPTRHEVYDALDEVFKDIEKRGFQTWAISPTVYVLDTIKLLSKRNKV